MMKFSENLIKLRKEKGWSQEQLAEKCEVSRQTIYKWESAQSYPEMDRMLLLSEIFNCSIDELMKSDIQIETIGLKQEYDTFYNTYARRIAFGVGLIIFGVAVMFFLFAMLGENAYMFPVGALLFHVLIGVAMFIYNGTQEEEFKKSIPLDADYYNANEKRVFSKKLGLAMTIAVSIIFLAIIIFITWLELTNITPFFPLSLMMTLIAIAVGIFVYFGILQEKVKMETKPKKQNATVEKLNGVIMMIATLIFLLLGFLQDAWHPAWVAFPIGGILCGIVSTIFQESNQ